MAVVVIGAAVQTGQRTQPMPAHTVGVPTIDPNRPVHQVNPGEYFLRRTTTTVDTGRGVQAYQRAAWFDDKGTMWSFSTMPDGTTASEGPLAPNDPANPLSFTQRIGDDPVAAEKVLAAQPSGLTDAVQQAADADLSPRQLRTLQQVLLRQDGARRLPDNADTLSRPAVVIDAPGRSGTVLRFYFDATTSEILQVRTFQVRSGRETELGRSLSLAEVVPGEPAPPFDPVVPDPTPPDPSRLNRPIAPGQYVKRSVTIETADGSSTSGSQWVDSEQRRWLGTDKRVDGPDKLPVPAGMSAQQYLAAMPARSDRIEGWFGKGLDPSCGACLLARADGLMLGNLDATQRDWVIAALARVEGATDQPTTDQRERPVRELRVPAETGGRTVEHVYRYDPDTKELLEWMVYDPDGRPSGVVGLTFTGSEVTSQTPRGAVR